MYFKLSKLRIKIIQVHEYTSQFYAHHANKIRSVAKLKM